MAYGIDEFPATSLQNYQLFEVLNICKKLKDDYSGLLTRMSAMETTQAGFPAIITSTVTQKVSEAIATYQSQMDTKINNALQQMKQTESTITEDLNRFKSDTDTWTEKWNNELIAHEKKLDSQLADFQNHMEELYRTHRNKLRSIVDTLIADVKAQEQNMQEVFNAYKNDLTEETHSTLYDYAVQYEAYTKRVNELEIDIRRHYHEYSLLLDEVNTLKKNVEEWQPSGQLVVPMTGERKEANEALADVYYSLLANFIPTVGEMNAYSPEIGRMEDEKERLWRMSTNNGKWYKPPYINPVSGQHQSLQGILSALQQSILQATNEAITMAGTTYEDITGAEASTIKRDVTFINNDDGCTYLGKAYIADKMHDVYLYNLVREVSSDKFRFHFSDGERILNFIAVQAEKNGKVIECEYSVEDNDLVVKPVQLLGSGWTVRTIFILATPKEETP